MLFMTRKESLFPIVCSLVVDSLTLSLVSRERIPSPLLLGFPSFVCFSWPVLSFEIPYGDDDISIPFITRRSLL